jgi:hypothetical protein
MLLAGSCQSGDFAGFRSQGVSCRPLADLKSIKGLFSQGRKDAEKTKAMT